MLTVLSRIVGLFKARLPTPLAQQEAKRLLSNTRGMTFVEAEAYLGIPDWSGSSHHQLSPRERTCWRQRLRHLLAVAAGEPP